MKISNLVREAAITIMAVFAISTSANAVTLNFDAQTRGTFLTNQFSSQGIIFDAAWVHDGLSPTRGSAPNWIAGEPCCGNNNANPNSISGQFVNSANPAQDATTDYFEALSVFADSDTTVILDVFDLSGLLLASIYRIDDGILSVSTPNIHRFTLSHINSGFSGIDDIIGFDNLMFNAVMPVLPGPTPDIAEPTTLALFGLGLAGLGYMRRRRSDPR